ncbi:EF-hand domain-containing protein [Streptomyces sp. MNP-20]|uniref:EF-hand domain-containing protein n=1 Tax=Streptomyces sp. MNP-20 TaxID=2721165 RepID=UPI0020A6C109|nr:EF-hand domain-containing protein [Streptomyces sp. MNP-20]
MSDTAKRRIFAMLDVDGDGVITRAEYLGRVDRAADACGRDPQHALVATARAAHEEVFRQMGSNADGTVTYEEYRDWAGQDAFEESCRPALGSLFDLADHDGDGHLTRDEFTRLRAATGNSPEGADAAFTALDTHRNGLIQRSVYLAAIHDFLTTGHSPMTHAYPPGTPATTTH